VNGLGILILIVVGVGVAVFWYLEHRIGPHRGNMTLQESMDEWKHVGGSGGMSPGG
jgi:hypothetical protein